GKLVKPNTPRIKMMMETTVDNTGLSINFFSMIKSYLNTTLSEAAMLSKATGWGCMGVLLRSLPTPSATILSPASRPEAIITKLSTLSLTDIEEETAKVSPCTWYTYTRPCCSKVADSGTTGTSSYVLGIR